MHQVGVCTATAVVLLPKSSHGPRTLETVVVLPSLSESMKEAETPEEGYASFDKKLMDFNNRITGLTTAQAQSLVAQGTRLTAMESKLNTLQVNAKALKGDVTKVYTLAEGAYKYIENCIATAGESFNERADQIDEIKNNIDSVFLELSEVQVGIENHFEELTKFDRMVLLERSLVTVSEKVTKNTRNVHKVAKAVDELRADQCVQVGTRQPVAAPIAPPDSREYGGNRLGLSPVRQPGGPSRPTFGGRQLPSPPGFAQQGYYQVHSGFEFPRQSARPAPVLSSDEPVCPPPPPVTSRPAVPMDSQVGRFSHVVHQEGGDDDVQCLPTLPVEEAGSGSCSQAAAVPPQPPRQGDASVVEVPIRLVTDIKSVIRNIRRVIDPALPTEFSEVRAMRADHLPQIKEFVKELERKVEKVEKSYPGQQGELLDRASETMRSAARWQIELVELFKKLDGHSVQSDKRDMEVKVFKRNSDQTIYHFFDDFEIYFKGSTPVEKARALYKRYLDPHFKNALIEFENDYPKMKDWLITRLGTKDECIAAILKKLAGKASPANDKSRVNRFCLLSTVLRELIAVAARPESQVNMDEYYNEFTQKSFIANFCTNFTPTELDEFQYRLMDKDIDPEFLYGRQVFDELVRYVKDRYKMYSAAEAVNAITPPRSPARSPNKSSQKKSANHSKSHMSPGRSPKQGWSSPGRNSKQGWSSPGRTSPNSFQTFTVGKNAEKDWYNKSVQKPCPLPHHGRHEVGTCAEFFSLTPRERREVSKNKLCWTCLDPLDRCRAINNNQSGKCAQEHKVKDLICYECDDVIRKRNNGKSSGVSVLMCTVESHRKPSLDHLMQILPTMIPGFTQSQRNTFVMSCMSQAFRATNAFDIDSESATANSGSWFDTPTGRGNPVTENNLNLNSNQNFNKFIPGHE